MAKGKYSSTDSASQVIKFQSVTFIEAPNDDGSLSVKWDECSAKTWKAILAAVKSMISPGYRHFDPEKKVWIVASSQLENWETIKRAFSDESDLDLRATLEQDATDQAVASLVLHEFRSLPDSMKRRAIFAVKAVLGLIDVPTEYSMTRGEFGAWNEEERVWCFTDGRYSNSSPQENDLKKKARDYQKIARAINELPELLNFMDSEPELAWKARFRMQMLEKYNYRCYICGNSPANQKHLHMHRVIPGHSGGEYIEDNVVVLCVKCHHHFEGLSWNDIHDAARKGEQS